MAYINIELQNLKVEFTIQESISEMNSSYEFGIILPASFIVSKSGFNTQIKEDSDSISVFFFCLYCNHGYA